MHTLNLYKSGFFSTLVGETKNTTQTLQNFNKY